MGISVFPAPSAASKTRYVTTLTSGTSYTVPTGATYLNVTLVGGGGSAAGSQGSATETSGTGHGYPGRSVWSTLTATPGASIAYAIGAGGAAQGSGESGVSGGTTTFTGATSAVGGSGGSLNAASTANGPTLANNGGFTGISRGGNAVQGGAGGAGFIIVEYWV